MNIIKVRVESESLSQVSFGKQLMHEKIYKEQTCLSKDKQDVTKKKKRERVLGCLGHELWVGGHKISKDGPKSSWSVLSEVEQKTKGVK